MRVPSRTTGLSRGERWLPRIYLLLALPINLLLCLLTPPFFAPDEPHHAARAIALGHGQWMAQLTPQEAGAAIDANALRVMDRMDSIREAAEKRGSSIRGASIFDRPWGPAEEDLQLRLSDTRWAHAPLFAPFPNTAMYPPMLYVPAVLGWRIGEAANLTIFQSLQLARALEALATIGIGWIALRICRCSRWLLFAYLLLPSALFLNATCSQDPLLLAAAGLSAALLSRALQEQREFTPGELGLMAVLLALCATARPPYLALGLLLFLPGAEMPVSSWRRPLRRQWGGPLLAFAGVLSAAAAWRHLVLPFGLETGIGADPDEQYLFLHAHPLAAAWYVAKGAGVSAFDFARRGLYVVGWNDLLAPLLLRSALALCWCALLLFAPTCSIRTWRGRLLLAVAALAPLLGLSFAEYIIWTPPGLDAVYGVQPRYWLPVLPLLAMLLQQALQPLHRRLNQTSSGARRVAPAVIMLSALAALAMLACTLPWIVAHAFYLDRVGHVLFVNLR